MNFKIIQNDKVIICNILFTFDDFSNNLKYVIYTDGTKDENGELEIYASRYQFVDGEMILNDIERDYEWDLVDNVLSSRLKEPK